MCNIYKVFCMPRVRKKTGIDTDCNKGCCACIPSDHGGHENSRIASGNAWTFFHRLGFHATVIKGFLTNTKGAIGREVKVPSNSIKHAPGLKNVHNYNHPIWVSSKDKNNVDYGCIHYVVRLEEGNLIVDWSIPYRSSPGILFI